MKKFLGKLPVMITFASLAVVMLVAYVGLLVRPVAIGFTYKGQQTSEYGSYSVVYDYELKVVSNKKIKAKQTATRIVGSTETVTTSEEVLYYFCKDGLMLTNSTVDNDEEYEQWKEMLNDDWDAYKSRGSKTNAFLITDEEGSYKCAGSIVFAVVGGIVLVSLMTFGTLSVIYFVKNKKRK